MKTLLLIALLALSGCTSLAGDIIPTWGQCELVDYQRKGICGSASGCKIKLALDC